MSLFCNYLLYQLPSRYIGQVPGYGDSELLPGSYVYIFDSEKLEDLDILIQESQSENAERKINNLDTILDFSLFIGEEHELLSEGKKHEIDKLGKYFESRHGIKVFSVSDQPMVEAPILYFFPRRVFRLKKLLPPNLGQLEQ